MKALSFLSKFTVICNLAFVVFAAINKFARISPPVTEGDGIPELNFFKNIIITLGFSAIVINFLMCLTYIIVIIIGKQKLLPKWLVMINFLFLIFQFYFFFL